jgi:hypothetical protein
MKSERQRDALCLLSLLTGAIFPNSSLHKNRYGIYFQPDRLLRTSDSVGDYLLAIIWFNEDVYPLYSGTGYAVALALRGSLQLQRI